MKKTNPTDDTIRTIGDMADEKEVILDFEEMTYQDAMETALIDAKLARVSILSQKVDQSDKDKLSPDVLDELLALSDPKMMEALFTRTRTLMAKMVQAVPRSWFVKSAPESLALNEPETYQWLRSEKGRELQQMIQKGRHTKN